MDWFESIGKAVAYIEAHLTDDMRAEDVACQAFSSVSHFQRVFTLLTGATMGDYIRNRRLTLAGRELAKGSGKVIDVAMKYGYDTSESFSKAFTRFHGFAPSKARSCAMSLRNYKPLTIQIRIQGGFDMPNPLRDPFLWNDAADGGTDAERYRRITDWAAHARGRNPKVFDELTMWMLDDAEWTVENLPDNEQILKRGVIDRFLEQNARLRQTLSSLQPASLVNDAIWKALDRFDDALRGDPYDESMRAAVTAMFADFSVMLDSDVRRIIAGCATGPSGTDSVPLFGYVNLLKECDAQVQWALFMPSLVERQQRGFRVDSFRCVHTAAMRFIGFEGEAYADTETRVSMMRGLDALSAYACEWTCDMLFMHHYGIGVDVGQWHGVWGRFLRADAPVPQGYMGIDFLPCNDGMSGPPYMSQFAYATFSGDSTAMHSRDGYDSDAMYDVTRNILLGKGILIPYPTKYWTAEVFPDGCDHDSTAYMFSCDIS